MRDPVKTRAAVAKLRDIISEASTADVLGFASSLLIMDRKQVREHYGLSSTYRQIQFLLGILSSTEEPLAPGSLDEAKWQTIARLLEVGFTAYADEVFVHTRHGQELSEREVRAIEVSGSTVLEHIMQGRLASIEQIRTRLVECFMDLSKNLKNALGFDAAQCLEMCEWIVSSVDNSMYEQGQRSRGFSSAHANWAASEENDEVGPLLEKAKEAGIAWMNGFKKFNAFRRADFLSRFNVHGEKFLQRFITHRGQHLDFVSPLQRNPARFAPLFKLDEEHITLPLGNALYDAVFDVFVETARNCFPDAYGRARARYTERKCVELFNRLLSRCIAYQNVFETEDLHYEHDLILVSERNVFVIESKAPKYVEPGLDPVRAFVRLENAFRGDQGVQKGFDQARSVLSKLRAGPLVIYNKKREKALELRPEDIDKSFTIVVTSENLGQLSCDLSLLLKKDTAERYPWVVNLYDLEAVVDAFAERGWGVKEFSNFLSERAGLHGRTFATDELSIAGAFVSYGSFERFQFEPEVKITMDFGDVFDELYKARARGKSLDFAIGAEPVFTNQRELIESQGLARKVRIGRNELCYCGSSLKFKRCCGMS